MSEQDIVKVEYLWESELNKTVSEVSYLVTPPATVPKYKKVKVRVFGAHYTCNIILHMVYGISGPSLLIESTDFMILPSV